MIYKLVLLVYLTVSICGLCSFLLSNTNNLVATRLQTWKVGFSFGPLVNLLSNPPPQCHPFIYMKIMSIFLLRREEEDQGDFMLGGTLPVLWLFMREWGVTAFASIVLCHQAAPPSARALKKYVKMVDSEVNMFLHSVF